MRRSIAQLLFATAWVSAGSLHAANIIVTSPADSGPGTLRQAILDANGNGQPDLIEFAAGLGTILPTAALPNISAPDTVIDGDPDNDCDPDVNVSGASAGNVGGIVVQGSATNSIVRGLALHSWQQTALSIGATGAIADCNFIGTDTGGVAVLPTGATGRSSVSLIGSSATFGPGNLVVNGRGAGVRVSEAQSNAYPDFVGSTSDAAPRVYPVVEFSEACGSFTGSGFTPVDGSGHPFTDNFAMRLRGRLTIGTSGSYTFDFTGLDDLARLRLDSVTIADLGNGVLTTSTTLTAGAHAIEIDFRENTGAARLPLTINGPGSATLTSDDQALCTTGQTGLCAELFQTRIAVGGNKITRNRIRDNVGLGIQMNLCGPYANDVGDADVGPNGLLNSPVIASVSSIGGGDYSVIGTAPAGSVVELFQAAPDPSGSGEGATFLAQATASAGGNFAIVAQIAAQGALTTTATDAAGNTSEFGRNFVYSSGASALYARGVSDASIELTWTDPNLGETGFRVERSTNGSAYTTAATLGPNATSHVDGGLSAATLYYYRVVATTAGGDAPASNRATASTFPASAAQVCFQRIDRTTGFALTPAVEFDGTAWAMAWSERDVTRDNIDLVFRRFDALTLAPIAPIVTVSDADMNITGTVRMAWNGTHHGVVWFESVRGAAGSPADSPLFFALLDVDGRKIRGNVRVEVPDPTFEPLTLLWDGGGWGLIGTVIVGDAAAPAAQFDLYLLRLTEDGPANGAPQLLTATAAENEFVTVAAWSPQKAQYGIAFARGHDDAYQLVFQRFGANGAPVDPSPIVLDTWTFAAGEFGLGSGVTLWDGTNWAVAHSRDDPTDTVETPVFLYRIDGNTGAPLGGPTRLSDDPVDPGSLPFALLAKPGGGYAAFSSTLGASNQFQISRMQADAAGARSGTMTYITPNDGNQRVRPEIADGGTRFLAAFGISGNATIPNEIYGVLFNADGSGAIPAPIALTAGHDANGADIPRQQQAAPLGAGFVGAWIDGPPATPRINARIWNGAGQVVSTLSPINAAATRPAIALTGVGSTFALAWKTPSNDVIFARYNATGGPITGEKTLVTAVGGGANLALGWSGESYAIIYQSAAGPRFLRVDESGNAIGSPVAIARAPDGGNAILQWLGDSWAFATRGGGVAAGNVDYLRLAPDGGVMAGPVALFGALASDQRGVRNQQLAYNGVALGLSYTNWLGFDPPGDDVFFKTLTKNGAEATAPVDVYGTTLDDTNARLYADGDGFRLIANSYGSTAGMRETALAADGTPQPNPRFISNRASGNGVVATAFNGVTLGTLYFASGLQHLYFHTSACLADATPPPCPVLATSVANGAVQASWSAVTDPQSGVIRYLLYRDGTQLAELDADVLSYADGGYALATPNTYEVRALNGAFVESAGCPAQVADVDSIFADGFE